MASALLLLGAVSAHAQPAPGAPPPPGGPEMGGMHPPMDGHRGYMGMHRGMMPMMQKSAGFRFKKDGAEIDIRCSAEETTKACVDAASVLIDKVAAFGAGH